MRKITVLFTALKEERIRTAGISCLLGIYFRWRKVHVKVQPAAVDQICVAAP